MPPPRADRVRVLWLIKGLGPGGAEQLLVNQAQAADHDRFDYRAAYLVPWKDHRVEQLEQAGVKVTLLDGPRDIDPRWMLRLRRLLLADPVEVVHNHSPLVASVTRTLVRSLPRDKRPALVYTEHNRWPRHNRYTRLANRLTYPLDDVQLSVSDDVIETIPTRQRAHVTTLVHGIDLAATRAKAAHRAAVRSELGIDEDEVVIGIVANFRKEKDYPTLLEAARITTQDSDIPVRFVSVGQGPLEEEIREQHRRLGLGERFLILGFQDDAVRTMAAFDIFTLSSRHEGLPVTLMDALALGLPVVATDVGGIGQAVTHGSEGLLVEPGRPELLAEAYRQLTADGDRRSEMSRRATERSSAFDITEATAELERLYAGASRRRR